MQAATHTFNDSVFELLRHAECRVVSGTAEMEAVYRLRYDSYLREGAIAPNPYRRIADRFDEAANSLVFGIYVDDTLSGSVRLSLSTPEHPETPAVDTFPDVLASYIDRRAIMLDPTRFVVDELSARKYPKLAYVTLRVAWLATEYFDADYTLASVRTEHQAFYRRFYGHTVACEARPYPSLIKPLSLMILDFRPNQARGLQRYPFLKASEAEKASLLSGMRVGVGHGLDRMPRAALEMCA